MKNASIAATAKKTTFLSAALFAAACALIVSGGFLYHRDQEASITRRKGEELSTIALDKAEAIAAWIDRCAMVARLTAEDSFFTAAVRSWFERPADPVPRGRIAARLEALRSGFGFDNVVIASAGGKVMLSLNSEVRELGAPLAAKTAESLEERKALFSDFYYCPLHRTIHLDFIAPLGGGERPAAALVFKADPADYLYPLVQSWPTPSGSSETLLVERDGGDVLFLNELRHLKNTALRLRIPLSRTDVPAVQAVLGRTGLFRGVDYRGIDVLSAVFPVRGTPWHIVAKVDAAEIFSDLSYRTATIVVAAVLLIGLSGSGFVVFSLSRRHRLYRMLYLAEKGLRESQDEFRATLYGIGDAVITTDSAGRVRRLNSPAARLTGWEEEAARGLDLERVFRIINEETRAPAESPARRVLSEGTVVGLANHTLLVARDGTETPIADSGAPILDESGAAVGVVLVFRDQTAERASRKALEESEERYRTVAQFTRDWEYWRAPDGSFAYVSPSCERLTGYSAREFLQDPTLMERIVFPEDRAALETHHTETLGSDAVTVSVDFRIVRKDGATRWLNHTCLPVFDPEGRPLGRRGSNRDISDRKRAEAEILRLNEELEARVERRTAQLEAANRELEAFAYSVSHDLRAPLRAIDGFTEILLEDHAPAFDAEGKRVCAVIQENTRRMGQLIDDLLSFSRLGRAELNRVRVDMRRAAENVYHEAAPASVRERIDFAVGDLPAAEGDPRMIRQVWANLISNALKFSAKRERPSVEVGGGLRGGETVYWVKDNGAGFDMAYADKLFGVFQRLHGRKEFEGTGVGLAIVKRVVERHGGRVWAEGEPGKGAAFYFTLPPGAANDEGGAHG